MTDEWKARLHGLAGKKPLVWAGILALCGVLLMIGPHTKKAPPPVQTVSQAAIEQALETRLQTLIGAITGEEKSRVLVTLEGDAQTVYATEDRTNTNGQSTRQNGTEESAQNRTDRENNYVIIKNADGSQSALRLTEIYPQVKGVVVVTPRAEDARMRERIVTAVATACGVSSAKVCVVLSD